MPKKKSDALSLSPSLLLDHLHVLNHPARLDELLNSLALPRNAKKALLALLDDLAARGDVMRLHGGRWLHAGLIRRIRGVLAVQKSGVAFVTPDKDSQQGGMLSGDVFIRADAQADAWDGDEVEIALMPHAGSDRPKGRTSGHTGERSGRKPDGRSDGRNPEGRVLRVISRGRTELIVQTTQKQTATGVLAQPTDSRIACMVDVDMTPLSERPVAGSLVRVHLEAQVEPGLWRATAMATLGCEQDATVQERLVKINHQIPMEFPSGVEQEAATLALNSRPETSTTEQKGREGREDMRDLDFVTIDGADARDFDDAVYVTTTKTGYRLHVAIADVSWYVRPGSGLDREARERGNSCYFPLSVEPMLPEALSTDLCSLRPDVDRYVMVAQMDIGNDGRVGASRFVPAVIRSRARLTYDGVQAELDRVKESTVVPAGRTAGSATGTTGATGATGTTGTTGGPVLPSISTGVPRPISAMLHTAATLARTLRRVRMDRGALDMDLPEPAYDVDDLGRVTAIRKATPLFAHHLIEEFMLCANEAVARFLASKDIPFPCRVHPEPDPDRLISLFHTMASASLPPNMLARLPAKPTASAIKPLLDAARGTPQAFVVNRLVLRTMMQARYSPDVAGHFGLASDCYCHFTSPIRRYADLIVHRALRHAVGQGVGPIPAHHKLLAVADQCNVRERAAQNAEREMTRRMACLLLAGHEGDIYEGVIAAVIDFGFFVELADMPVEGMVRIATLDDDWYAYDSDRQELAGVGTGRAFRVGQPITVRLERADLGRLEIDLALIRSARDDAPRRRGGAPRAGVAASRSRPPKPGRAQAQPKDRRHAPHRQGNQGQTTRGKRSDRG